MSRDVGDRARALQLVRRAERMVPGLRGDARYWDVVHTYGETSARAMEHLAGVLGCALDRGDIEATAYADWMYRARRIGGES